jgi:PBP1b-binding outer membrane lipoprotein LpoB
MNAMKLTILTITLAAAVMTGCSGSRNREITRVDPNVVTDVDYRWTGDDAREVYRALVNDALYRQWVDNWMRENAGQRPIVIIGPVRNETQDYIDSTFATEWQRELLNSQRIRFVARADQRQPIRDERLQGQEWNTPETRKQMRAELGADLMLLGTINDNVQRSPDNRNVVKEYNVNLQLINIESNELLWSGSHAIKKLVRQ